MAEKLDDFIKDCYKAGKTHAEIEAALLESGWEKRIVDESLSKFINKPFPVAIPKPTIYVSPRLTFLNLFYFIVLFIACFDAIAMVFTILDSYIPDGLGRSEGFFYSSDPLSEAVRSYLAAIICSVPLVIWTSKMIANSIKKTEQNIPRIRLNLIYLTMLILACIMLGNGITFIYYFLSGELGIRFIIKILILSLFSSGLYLYFRSETRQIEKFS